MRKLEFQLPVQDLTYDQIYAFSDLLMKAIIKDDNSKMNNPGAEPEVSGLKQSFTTLFSNCNYDSQTGILKFVLNPDLI